MRPFSFGAQSQFLPRYKGAIIPKPASTAEPHPLQRSTSTLLNRAGVTQKDIRIIHSTTTRRAIDKMTSQSPIQIAVLDDYLDISQKHFSSLDSSQFKVTIFKDAFLPFNHPSTPQSAKDNIVQTLQPFAIISTMRERTPFPATLLQSLLNLKFLLTTGVRNASIDMNAAKQLGIRVVGAKEPGRLSYEPGSAKPKARAGPDSTTQHAVALILGIARNLALDDATVKSGGWESLPTTTLSGKTFGAVGLGRLGVNVARILYQSFGMRIIAWSSSLTQEAADEKAKAAGLPVEDPETGEKTFKAVSKEELYSTADIVSVHYVLSDRSRGMVTSKELGLMKPLSFFINTSRGPLVVEKDLLDILYQGKILGAAIDVYDIEPLPKDSAWRTTKWGTEGRSQVLLSPHMGYVERDVMNGWYESQVANIKRWKNGEEVTDVLA
ncbi:D-isomer specific 2-hydroxyacid dehydrogenase [Xylogone sp. PMI_703]|nr:D-isomer specific 2-hydroxyacid dehydrogenase [Xylogone sp. PMI_703]